MTNRVQTIRSNVSGNRPTGRPPGELYVNWADGQIGAINSANAAQDLIPVRFFSTAANYVVGDFVVQTGQLYRAVAPSTPGAFKPANWSQIGGSITTGDVAPTTPQPGTLWWDSVGGQLYVWYTDANSSQWIIAVNTANFPSITIGATPPVNPVTGDMWWDSIGAQLYIWYADANSSQWVPSTNQLGGNFQSLTGVTDGSNAPTGQIGEVLTAVQTVSVPLTASTIAAITSLPLPPGDWDITAEGDITAAAVGATSMYAGLNTVVNFPGAPALNVARAAIGIVASTLTTAPGFFALHCRANIPAPVTYYLLGQCNSVAGNGLGWISARRAR